MSSAAARIQNSDNGIYADRLQLVDAPVITDNEMGFGEYGGVQVVAISADTTETLCCRCYCR